jgi:two-component system CheB/CheR fusion protein
VAAGDKGLALSSTIDPLVPGLLVGDSGRLKQILTNIVGNAVKFTRQGEVSVRVWLDRGGEARPDGPGEPVRLLFEVRDTGVGIPEDRLEAIFESFTQAGSSAHAEFGGTGLGLTISRQLVEMMGGRIWVESRPGQGSVFRFTAPFADAERRRPPQRGAGGEIEAGPLRVLLVEDNEVNRVVVERLLRKRGHTVESAENGAAALEKLAAARFDLVLMDVRMPVMDGVTAVRLLRSGAPAGVDPGTVVYALTAHALEEDRHRLLSAGMDGYIAKPVEPLDLEEALRVAADRESGRATRTE